MSEPDVATKAPESDAAEAPASIVPGDTPAQSGASLGVGNLELLRIRGMADLLFRSTV